MRDNIFVAYIVNGSYFVESVDVLIDEILKLYTYEDFYNHVNSCLEYRIEIPFYGTLDVEDVFELICSPFEKEDYFRQYLDYEREYYEDEIWMMKVGDKDNYYGIPFIVVSKEDFDACYNDEITEEELYEKYDAPKG